MTQNVILFCTVTVSVISSLVVYMKNAFSIRFALGGGGGGGGGEEVVD